jgi:hypothetical protein
MPMQPLAVRFTPDNGLAATVALQLTTFRVTQLICPSCQCAAGVCLVPSGKSEAFFRAFRAREEGRFAIVT